MSDPMTEVVVVPSTHARLLCARLAVEDDFSHKGLVFCDDFFCLYLTLHNIHRIKLK